MAVKKTLSVLVAMACASLSSNALAQAHNHGHGEVFIVQQGKQWQIQFTLPSADVFGFEHEPENTAQQAHVDTQIQKLEKSESLITTPSNCVLDAYELETPFAEHHTDHDDDEHDAHDDHDEHSEESHSDVEVLISLNCKSAIRNLAFNAFESLTSLEELDVEWSVNTGQGSAEVSAASPVVRF